MRFIRSLAGLLALFALAACSGGGGRSTPAPGSASATGTAQFAFTFYNPSLSSRTRRPKFASNQTASITIAVNGAHDPLLFNVDTGASYCNAAGTVCGISVSAPAGNDTFAITLYDADFAKGNILGTQTVDATIAPGAAQQIPISIAAVPFNVNIKFTAATNIAPGTPASIPITLSAYDEGGALIVGTYATPIPIGLIDPSGATSLSSASVSSSSQPITLNYNGSANFTRAQIQSMLAAGAVQSHDTIYATTPSLIYVSSPFSNAIYAYPIAGKAATPPTLTIAGSATQLNNPEGFTYDAAGNLYVLNAPAAGTHSITIYAPGASGNVAPLRTIAGLKTQLNLAYGDIALDPARDIVVHSLKAVLRFSPTANGNVAPASAITGLNAPIANGMAFDAAGDLYLIAAAAVPSDLTGNLLVFAPGAQGAAVPMRKIGGSATGIINALGVRLDAAANMYVIDNDSNMTFWPSSTAITKFPAGSQGNIAPATALSGPDASIGGAQAFALDSGGYMFILAPLGTGRIVTHAITDSGNTRALQVLLDSSFRFAPAAISPIAIAVR